MHMGDALLSPAVGGVFVAASGAALVYSARRVSRDAEDQQVPLMGVLGAFVFAAQMINFAIPGTGSSGHLGGGMLLAILLGPYAGFLVMSSILVIQALLFSDGGLLALGTNIFNLGIWPCFLGFLIYRAIAGGGNGRTRHWVASIAAVVACLELGALGVVLQTLLSGRTDLPFGRFALLMAGIHLPIALVEGVVTAAVVEFVRSVRPGIVGRVVDGNGGARSSRESLVPVVVSIAAMAVLVGGVFSWFASEKPDGLEWALERTGAELVVSPAPGLTNLQDQTALMPDYSFPAGEGSDSAQYARAGTSAAGILGGGITFALVALISFLLFLFRSRGAATPQ